MGKMELPLTMMRKTSGKANLEERSELLILRCQLTSKTEDRGSLEFREGGLGWRYKFASL